MTQLGPDFSDEELAAIALALGQDVALDFLKLLKAEREWNLGDELEREALRSGIGRDCRRAVVLQTQTDDNPCGDAPPIGREEAADRA